MCYKFENLFFLLSKLFFCMKLLETELKISRYLLNKLTVKNKIIQNLSRTTSSTNFILPPPNNTFILT